MFGQVSSALQSSLLKGRTVTSQKDQIQRLIAEINATLAKPASRLPLGLSGEAERQRQLLGELFSYLQSLEKMFDSPGGWGPIDPGTGQFVAAQTATPDVEESASQVLQGLLLEMQYLRENSLKPMRQELEALQQKRDSLHAELNVLEGQRGVSPLQSEQQINAFLETLMQRLQEQLSVQMVQNFAAMETAAIEQMSATDNPSPMLSQQRLEQVRLLQAQSDQLLLKLDSTLTAVFGSLQKSVDSYRDSLEEGLNQMHGLGRQGEVIFHAFINHLAQQLGQDASLYLTGELRETTEQAVQPGITTDVDLNAIQLDELDQALENLALEESIGNASSIDTGLAVDPDLALLDDAIAPDLTSQIDFDEDITVIQTDEPSELDQLEDAISFDEDEDITAIQIDGDVNQGVDIDISDLEEEITAIQTDGAFDLDLLEETTTSDEAITAIQTDDAFDLDLLATATGSDHDSEPGNKELLGTEDSDSEEPFELPLFEEDNSDNITAELSAAPASLNLDLGLEDIDESFGLLATGTDRSQSVDATSDDLTDPSELPQLETENELFSFDLAAGPQSDEVETADLFADASFTGKSTDIEDTIEPPSVFNITAAETADSLPGPDQTTDENLAEANQIADDWLFGQATTGEIVDNTPSSSSGPLNALPIAPMGVADELPEATVETLFGDSLAAENEPSDEGPDGDTVASLSDLLPDDQTSDIVEDFPDNVPDDVYIPASTDEDLLNLVESGTEQRLLIDFDDGPLVEQLDEDLQRLAGEDNFSPDYSVEVDEALEPLDQNTLETIVRDLNLEDVDFDTELGAELTGDEGLEEIGASVNQTENINPERNADVLPQVSEVSTDHDLFEGFATDIVDVDDPSEDELDIASITSSFVEDAEPETEDLDLLGLVVDPLTDDFNDDLSDSLADELSGLSEQSNALSQASTEEMLEIGLSDLEAPVIDPAETPEIPAVQEAEPQLDSASLPDVPPDFEASVPLEEDIDNSPEADDFLQAEQEAFWQTMAEDQRPESFVAPISDSPNVLDVTDNVEADLTFEVASTLEQSDDGAFDDTAVTLEQADDVAPDLTFETAATNDDTDNLLLLDELPSSSNDLVDENDLDLGDLDQLFGQSTLPELEALDQDVPAINDLQTTDPLAEFGLDMEAPPSEGLISEPEAFIPDVAPPSGPVAEPVLPVIEPIAPVIEPIADDSVTAEAVATPASPITSPPDPIVDLEGNWFLGLDIGSTGLSAVLMNRRTGQVYPLYWQAGTDDTKHFRLPALAVMTVAQDTVAVGYDALGDFEDLLDTFGSKNPELVGINRLKLLLKVAVGHGHTFSESEPWLRWSDSLELPMLQVLQAMVALLKYLVDRGQAVGLESNSLQHIWENLQGVVVGYPTNWPDTYSFNLREAVLSAGLIDQPEQILFVEDAIATILSGLPDPHDVSLADTVSLSRQPSLYNCQWQEGTVVISGGAVMTELGLVNLPKDLTNLNYADFALRGFAYAGDALDQDIVCQLLLPAEKRQPSTEADAAGGTTWDWQGHLTLEEADWSQLNDLTLPAVGHVDWIQRYQLQQRLLGSKLGQSLLAAARHLKLTLQQQNQMHITLAGQRWLIKRRHLENLIFLPYIQRINRYLNVLLSHHTVDTQAIKQVICTGGSASLPAIARWLRQKFPNATIIQDTYASELPHSCSRVAYGLVNLARYPQVLNVTRQQYSDYFLLMELLRVFPQQPLPVGAIMHLLEQQGINTQACHLHILALLEGHLPPGLVPTSADRGLIGDRTADLPTYRALLQTPLFSKRVTESGGQIYIPNEAQAERLRTYINRLLVDKVQTLEEPLIAHLEALV